jgi:hypothetical protein
MSEAEAQFELRSGPTWESPWGMYRALRDHDPLHHVEDGDFYFMSRFEDVWEAAADPETFSSAKGLTVDYTELEAVGLADNMPIVFLDPPEHTEFRRRLTRSLTPRKVMTIEPDIRAFVVERVEKCKAMGNADIVAELFKPLPSMVVAHYLGVPQEDRTLFDKWTDAIVQAAAAGSVDDAGDAFSDLLGYFAVLAERRRTEPADDIVSDLVAVGEENVSISRILGFAFTMVTGGNDTVTGLLGGAACLLTQNPAEREKLLADPSLVPNAVEEFLRLTTPAQNLARTTTRDVELHGRVIPEGRRVLLGYGSGNRDERQFGDTAGECRVDREIRKTLALSVGTHYCLGAAAARLQSQIALEELLVRTPDFTVDVEAGEYARGNYVRRHTSLPWSAN